MKINVFTKNVYGNSKLYAAGEIRATLRALTGRETLNDRDIKALESLGHTIRIFDSEMLAHAELN